MMPEWLHDFAVGLLELLLYVIVFGSGFCLAVYVVCIIAKWVFC